MAQITQEELDEILELHEIYLNGGSGGVQADFEEMDLSGLNFRGADLGSVNFNNSDLSGADLHGCILNGASLSEVDFTMANLASASFVDADLYSAKLSGANLEGTDFTKAMLEDADFNYKENFVDKPTILLNTVFTDANLSFANFGSVDVKGVDFTRTDLGNSNIESSSFTNCCFDEVHFSNYTERDGVKIKDCSFNKAILRNMVFKDNEPLENISFSGADLSGSEFAYGVVSNCDFSGANLDNFKSKDQFINCNFADAKLDKALILKAIPQEELDDILEKHEAWLLGEPEGIKADFHNMNLRGLDFRGSDLHGVDFSGADLTGADLHYCNCERCNFVGANLAEADLHLSFFEEADFGKANLGGANLEGSRFIRADFKETNFDNNYNSNYDSSLEPFDPEEDDYVRNHTNLNRANFSGAYFENADMEGLRCDGANFTGAKFINSDLMSSYLTNCKFDGSQFEGFESLYAVDLSDCSFNNAFLRNMHLYGEDGIKNVSFVGADLSGSIVTWGEEVNCDYTAANLSGIKTDDYFTDCDFSDAFLYGSVFNGTKEQDRHLCNDAERTPADFELATIVRNDLGKVSFDDSSDVKSILLDSDMHSERKLEKITQEEFDKIAKMHEAYLDGKPDGQKADLRNKDLSGIYFCDEKMIGYNLSGAVLSHCNLDGAFMSFTNLSGADMVGVSVKDAKASDCNFEGISAYYSDWTNTELQRNDFTNGKMMVSKFNAYGNVEDCSFKNAILDGSEISYDFVKNTSFENARLASTDFKFERSMELHNCNFDKADLAASKFITEAYNCSFKGTDFSDSNIALFSDGNNFDNAVFRNNKLAFGYCLESSFNSAYFDNVSIKESVFNQGTSFKNTTFESVYIVDTKFNNCDMKGSHFIEGKLESVDFTASDLSGSSMRMLKTGSKVDLSSAILSGVDADDKSKESLPVERKTARFLQSTTGRTNEEGRGTETVQYRVFESSVESALEAAQKEYVKNNSGKFAGNTQVVAGLSNSSKSSEGNYFVEVKANNVLIERVKPGMTKKSQEIGVTSKPVHLDKAEKKPRTGRSNEGR